MSDFTAQVSAFAAKTQQRLEAVQRDAAQELVEEVLTPVAQGGNMPVKTGFLRSSLRGSTEVMPSIDPGAAPPEGAVPNSYSPDTAQISLAIADWQLGATLYIGFTANYASYQEAKRQFVGLSAQNWQAIVNRSVAKLETALSRPE